MKTFRFLALALSLGLAAARLPSLASAADVTVFAAASLSDALRELAPACASKTGHTMKFNLGASGPLARQIEEGAPADVFFSADEARMDQLAQRGRLLDGTRQTVLANTLVVVVHADSPLKLSALEELREPTFARIAIGEPATVPAGTYTKQHLTKLLLWDALQTKMVPVENVRAALAVVESGNADAGFVYRTDALAARKARIALEVSLADGPRIAYPVAVVKESKQTEAARAVVAFLAGAEAQAVFVRHGFLVPR